MEGGSLNIAEYTGERLSQKCLRNDIATPERVTKLKMCLCLGLGDTRTTKWETWITALLTLISC